MAAGRCLSDLPDDLLRSILHLAPAKEAASTAMLSRRWRSLWLTSGAVNIDSRVSSGTADRFVRGVRAALDAARPSPIRRLTVHVELAAGTYGEAKAMYTSLSNKYSSSSADLMDAVVSHPAARGVEVIHVGAHATCDYDLTVWYYTLSYGALPSEVLRVLHITKCSGFMPAPPGTAFPRLAELRLRSCWVSVKGLQAMINVSPQLLTIHLERIYLDNSDEEEQEGQVLCCPSVTALVFKNCYSVQLDVPRVQYLSFKGSIHTGSRRQLSFKSHELPLDRVDIHLTDNIREFENMVREPFWQFLRNFRKAKVLKLKMEYPIGHVAVVDKKDQDQLLCNVMFHNLKRLVLQGSYEGSGKVAAVSIANLLHSCPVLCDLHLQLTVSHFPLILQGTARRDFNESVEIFKQFQNSLGGGAGHHDGTYEVSDIPSLSGHSFKCLQSCLRRVTLQLRMQNDLNCFGTQLVKFFTQNAAVLEELYIDDGIHRICEHIWTPSRFGRWSANLPKTRNSLTARGGITVLPHET